MKKSLKEEIKKMYEEYQETQNNQPDGLETILKQKLKPKKVFLKQKRDYVPDSYHRKVPQPDNLQEILKQRKDRMIRMKSRDRSLLELKNMTWQEIGTSENIDIDQPEQPKVLRTALLGNPNVGKSSLMNRFIGEKVSAVSQKPCTTRSNTRGVLNIDEFQIIFVDTPGIINQAERKLYQLNSKIMAEAFRTLSRSDMLLFFIDASKDLQEVEYLVRNLDLFLQKNPKLLPLGIYAVLNKVDMIVPKIRIDSIVADVQKMGIFDRVFPVSTTRGDGCNELQYFLQSKCKAGEWEYGKTDISNLKKEDRILEMIREKFFLYLHKEVPYSITCKLATPIELYTDKNTKQNKVGVSIDIICPNAATLRIVVGQLKRIRNDVIPEIESFFQRKVRLDILAKIGDIYLPVDEES